MPSLQNIEQFKEILNALGNEPQILAERGEALEDVKPPEEGLPQDLSDLLGGGDALQSSEEEAMPGIQEEVPAEESLDMFPEQSMEEEQASEASDAEREEITESDLDSLFSGIEPEETARPEGEQGLGGQEDEDVFSDLDLDALRDAEIPDGTSEEEMGSAENFELPEAEDTEGAESFELPEAEETEFAEGMNADFPDLADFETPAKEPGEAEKESEAPEEFATQEEDTAFALPSDVDVGGEESAEAEVPAELPDEFELGEFGEGEGGIEKEAEEEVGQEIEGFDIPESPEEEPSEGSEDEFGLPDFGVESPEQEAPESAEEGLDFSLPGETGGEPAEGEKEGGEDDTFSSDFDLGAPMDDSAPDTLAEEFSLGDFGQEFGISDEMESQEEALDKDLLAAVGTGEAETAEEAEPEEVSEEDFKKIKATLSGLPRNVKIAVEELIGEKNLSGEDLGKMLSLLISGAEAKTIATFAGRLIGKKLSVPKGYERKTGEAFEEQKKSFAYAFKKNILPILKILVLAGIGLAFLTYIGYEFAYKPLYSESLYNQGYRMIASERYSQANERFEDAVKILPKKQWFYKYAEGFTAKKQYIFAERKYDELLARYPGDKKGILDYARLESKIMANYEKAEQLLKIPLEKDMYDREALLAMGDNYLDWADEDAAKYEDARKAYAMLLQKFGEQRDVLFRMLRYFIRTDKMEEVQRLKTYFERDKKQKIDPDAYAELSGYLISKNTIDDVKDLLFRAFDQDPGLPEIHFQLARYFEKVKERTEEQKALKNALYFLQQAGPLTPRRTAMLVKTYNRTGELSYETGEFLVAEKSFQKGIALYEESLRRKMLKQAPEYGKLYSNLGDIYYYVSGEYDAAFEQYRAAERNLFSEPNLNYKKAFIHYKNQKYQEALLELYKAAGSFSTNKNIMYATANVLYKRNDFFAAEGYLTHLLDMLLAEARRIPRLNLQEKPEHKALLEMIMKTYNNLGVTMHQLARRTGDDSKDSKALVQLTFSSDYYDKLSRDPETLERNQGVNLSYLNMRGILYPRSNFEPQLYTAIPKDMSELFF